MGENELAPFRLHLSSFASRIDRWWRALPFKARVVLGIFLLAACWLGLRHALGAADSSLQLRVHHGFRSAQLTVQIDGHNRYCGKLVGYSKKKYAIFGQTVEGSLSEVFPVPSGAHQVVLKVEPDDGTIQEERIRGVFASGRTRELAVSARHSGLIMSWVQSWPAASPGQQTPSWFSKYAGSLTLTIAGSIASALTGFAMRELPGYLRSRQESAPKPTSQASIL